MKWFQAFVVLALCFAGMIFWSMVASVAGDMPGVDLKFSNPVISVVQPVGNDPVFDKAYADVNRENSVTNVITASAFGVYVGVIIIGGLGLSLIWIITKRR